MSQSRALFIEHKGAGCALFAAVAGSAFSPATLVNVPFGLFIIDLQDAFGWSRSEISLSLSVFIIALIATLPCVGFLLDKVGIRRILLISIPAYAMSLASLGWADGSLSRFYVTFAILAILSAGAQSLTYITLVSYWFDRKRGLAIGICMAGFGIGYMVVPQFTQWMISSHGWRVAYQGLGALALVGAFLPALVWARMPRKKTDEAISGGQVTIGLSIGEALKTRAFWLLAAIFVLGSLTLNGVQSQLVPLLVDDGMAAATATIMLSAVGVGSFPGRILAGYLMDRVFAPRIVFFFFSLSLIGIGLLFMGGNAAIFIAAICIGLSLGAENDALGFMTGRFFGMKSFGRLYSLLLCAYLVGAAAGPVIMASSYDVSGSYATGLVIGLISLTCACVMLMFLPRYGDHK